MAGSPNHYDHEEVELGFDCEGEDVENQEPNRESVPSTDASHTKDEAPLFRQTLNSSTQSDPVSCSFNLDNFEELGGRYPR